MRGSVQYPSRRIAVQTGLCCLAALVFLVGALWILGSMGGRREKAVSLSMRASSLGKEAHEGNIYVLNEQQGTILQVGRFKTDASGTRLNLQMPESLAATDLRWGLQYWHSAYSGYQPYMSFLHDDRLKEQMNELVTEVFKDHRLRDEAQGLTEEVLKELFEKAKPRLEEVTDDEVIRSMMTDIVAEEGGRIVRKVGGQPKERQWMKPLMDEVMRIVETWPWEEWIKEITENKSNQESVERLVDDLEPYLREALQHILWNQDSELEPGPEYAPNVRLLWVARRTLFGARKPAITLMLKPQGQPLKADNTLEIQEVK